MSLKLTLLFKLKLALAIIILSIASISTITYASGNEHKIKVKEAALAPSPKDIQLNRALEYLSSQQSKNGSWTSKKSSLSIGVTSITLLAFLSNGNTQTSGKYKENVMSGTKWLLKHIQPNGRIGQAKPSVYMYSHAFASIYLGTLYNTTKDPSLKKVCVDAVNYIIKAQGKYGSWGYYNDTDGSSFGTAIQILALKSIQQNDITKIDQAIYHNAIKILKTRISSNGSTIGYISNKRNRKFANLGSHASASSALAILINDNSALIKQPAITPLMEFSLQAIISADKTKVTPLFLLFGSIQGCATNEKYQLEFAKHIGQLLNKRQLKDGSFGNKLDTAWSVLALTPPEKIFPFLRTKHQQ